MMQTIDFILAIPLLWGLIIGFKKGLILELASLAALVLGVLGSLAFSDYAGKHLSEMLEIPPAYLSLVSLFVTFILIVFGVFLIAKFLDKMLKIIALGFINRLAGALFGLLKYGLICSFALYFLSMVNQKVSFLPNNYHKDSLLYEPIMLLKEPFSLLTSNFDLNEIESPGDEQE